MLNRRVGHATSIFIKWMLQSTTKQHSSAKQMEQMEARYPRNTSKYRYPILRRFAGLGVYIAIGERAHAIFFKGVIHQCLVRCIWCSRCRSDPIGSTCNVDDCPYGPSTYPSFADVIDVMFFFKKFCGYEIFGIFLDLQRNAYQDFFSEKKDSAVSRSTLKTITCHSPVMTSRVCLRNYTLAENLTPPTLGPYLAEVDSSC